MIRVAFSALCAALLLSGCHDKQKADRAAINAVRDLEDRIDVLENKIQQQDNYVHSVRTRVIMLESDVQRLKQENQFR